MPKESKYIVEISNHLFCFLVCSLTLQEIISQANALPCERDITAKEYWRFGK
jgi:hypothetical protein